MNNQEYLAHGSGELAGDACLADHPRHCLCTGCATERELERGGRYDSSIASHLHHIKDLRELREVPDSTGAGEKASGAAAVADSEQRESVPNRMKGAA